METLLMKTQQMMTSLEIAELTGKQLEISADVPYTKGPVPFVHYSCVSTMVPLVQSTTGVCAKMRPRELVTDA